MKKRLFRNSEVVTIKDALGLEWDIKEARATKYGFDLYYGKRKDRTGYDVGGPNRLIYSKELKSILGEICSQARWNHIRLAGWAHNPERGPARRRDDHSDCAPALDSDARRPDLSSGTRQDCGRGEPR